MAGGLDAAVSERNDFRNDSHLRDCDDCAYVVAQAEAEGRRRGWNEALDAAREAVERVSTLFEPLGPALAAIDALREEQK